MKKIWSQPKIVLISSVKHILYRRDGTEEIDWQKSTANQNSEHSMLYKACIIALK